MKKILVSFSICLLFSACSTDFDTIAPYKEVMVIYGLLNPNAIDTTQYIKITKAFLGEGNALIMAQQKDSINYGDVLTVKMEKVVNGTVVDTLQLTRDTSIAKDSGTFSSPYQVIYKYNFLLFKDENTRYRITVTNSRTGNVATSETNIVGDVGILQPDPNHNPNYKFKFATPLPFTAQLKQTHFAVAYNVVLRIHYKETNMSSTVSTMKYFDWNLGEQYIAHYSSVTPVDFKFYPNDFYNQVANHVPFDANVYRSLDSLDAGFKPLEILFTSASQDLYTYILLTGPSYGLVQDRPVFSNIENGLGLFTSRNVQSELLAVDSISIANLQTNGFTSTLNFR